VAYADIEQIVIGWLVVNVFPGAGVDRVRVTEGGSDRPDNLIATARVVTVEKIPSSAGDTTPTLDVVDLEVNCYARNRARTRDMAEQVRTALRYQLAKHTDPGTGAFITQVRTSRPPVEAPWETKDTVRYLASYRLWVHHSPV
jgi:hypothetical protein